MYSFVMHSFGIVPQNTVFLNFINLKKTTRSCHWKSDFIKKLEDIISKDVGTTGKRYFF